ncbi:hypothetical protein LX59_03023 [Azomonas agilis]|uniref:Uncharacterized protein n=1 Tax=Azomonas agilis TaxID=116849 RepID=A0A562HYK4_9GAMM|nr:hypothetical protein [Azomonas agilis]TWH63859.1 hypothetical protein LX59_03023 [Azomonas agilis]
MDLVLPPRFAAQLDWAQTGSFNPERFHGDDRREYLEEAARIEREYERNWSRHHVQES